MSDLFIKNKPKKAQTLSKTSTAQNQDTPDSTQTLADINKALGNSTIRHGVQEFSYNITGKSIAYVREALGPIMQVPKDAAVYINGVEVKDESTLIAANTSMEFMKPSGEKGAITYTKDLWQLTPPTTPPSPPTPPPPTLPPTLPPPPLL